MRFAQTPTEEALWQQLRGGKLGVVVRRQYVVGRRGWRVLRLPAEHVARDVTEAVRRVREALGGGG